jgi:hydrogenase nickel incorporation protein HypB
VDERLIRFEQRLLARNDAQASELRWRFLRAGTFVVNLASSPGAGKTTLLEATVQALGGGSHVGVIVGDLATDNDARRLAQAGGRVRQITTGTTCHLEAAMIQAALDGWNLDELDYLFIENVGNLVCPAAFDLGEAARVVLFAVTEGEDKPEKYPPLVHQADLILLTKWDLAPLLAFDEERFTEAVRRVNARVAILTVSARTGVGLGAWLDWLQQQRALQLTQWGAKKGADRVSRDSGAGD